jgi:CRP-like cAMP-binding protein
MNKGVWFLEEVNLYDILCPYKYADHLKNHPLSAYNRNDFLFMEGDPTKEIFLVASGKVKVGCYDQEGNEQVFALLGKGEILGEMGLFGSARHKEFAQVTQDKTMICKLGMEKARELSRDYVPFSLTLNKYFALRVQKMERRLQILLFKDTRQRLVEFLKDLCDSVGMPYKTGVKIDLDMTQSDIAALIGSSRKTVSLLFSDLENEGIVEFFKRKEMYVPNLKNLV